MRLICLPALASAALASAALPLAAQAVVAAGKPTTTRDLAPRFRATEGHDGTGNRLGYGELVPLGSEAVDGGPNEGTRIRVTNVGEFAMRLGAPELGGFAPDDFAVEVDALALGAELGAETRGAPFRRERSSGGAGIALRIDSAEVARLRALREVTWSDFPLAELGPVSLALRRRELPIAPDAKLVVDGRERPGGLAAVTRGLQAWSGRVVGIEGSRAFLVLGEGSVWGFVELPSALGGRVHVVGQGDGRARVAREEELPELGSGGAPCAGALYPPGRVAPSPAPLSGGAVAATVSDCRLAIETDWQLRQKFFALSGLVNYVTGLVAAASDQFLADVQTTLSIAYLGVHTTSNDGWTSQETGGGTYELLEEFRAAWGTTWPAEADLAHFLSGAGLGGGIAYLDVLCHAEYGFAVSANLGADIDWSTWTGAPGDFWDFMVFAHELGHNFGSPHTQDFCPPLDQCVSNCTGTSVCTRGTIMSYCHLCSGGVANVDLLFHPVTAELMRERVNASCLGEALVGPGDHVQYRVRFNPLTVPGNRTATLDFAHDAANAPSPFRVNLSGIAF